MAFTIGICDDCPEQIELLMQYMNLLQIVSRGRQSVYKVQAGQGFKEVKTEMTGCWRIGTYLNACRFCLGGKTTVPRGEQSPHVLPCQVIEESGSLL